MKKQTTIYINILEDINGAVVFAGTRRNNFNECYPVQEHIDLAKSIDSDLTFNGQGYAVSPDEGKVADASWWSEFSDRVVSICSDNPKVKTEVTVVESFPQGNAKVIKVVAFWDKPKDRFAAPKDIPLIPEFQSGDGAHCGLADWYPEKEKALAAALATGKPFDTGWYGSKKEIASARVYSPDGRRVCVEASVSDDFDTEGVGSAEVRGKPTLEKISEAIYKAWDEAEECQKGNRAYIGFKVLARKRVYGSYVGGKPQGEGRMADSWVETLILPQGDGCYFDRPPGDSYHQWGWQHDGEKIPKATRDQLDDWAQDYRDGNAKGDSLTVGKWTIKPWND